MNKINIVEKDIKIDKIKKSFPTTIKNIEDIQMTTEGLYSVSGTHASKHLCNLIKKFFKNRMNLIITDATANNGSDTIMLAQNFDTINAIEKDEINFNVLKHNISLYDLKNINLFNASLLDIIPTIKQDVIYIDAPWKTTHEENYKLSNCLKLYIDNKEISEILKIYKKYCKLFIFKVPINYDFTNFIQKTNVNKCYIYSYSNKHNIIKFYYLFVY